MASVVSAITNALGGNISDGIAKIIGLFKIDPTIALQKQVELTEIQLKMQSDIATAVAAQVQGQIDINKVEAASQSMFVAGWRPFLGWVCGAAFAYGFVLQPIAIAVFVAFKPTFDKNLLPTVDMTNMMPVLFGMLGLGAMRSYDKTKGTSNGH